MSRPALEIRPQASPRNFNSCLPMPVISSSVSGGTMPWSIPRFDGTRTVGGRGDGEHYIRPPVALAGCETESTTSIHAGFLHMSDVIAMQPNLNIPLYLVAPDERREKVLIEVNRPTFSRLSPPMNQMCRFVSFSSLRDAISRYAPMVRHLNPAFLEDISESCEVEEED